MAYKLEFVSSTNLHLVFHVSNLKLFHDLDTPAAELFLQVCQKLPHPNLSPCLNFRCFVNIPEALIHWQHTFPAEASWETVHPMQQCFPHFPLEDKRDLKDMNNVSTPLRLPMVYWIFKKVRKIADFSLSVSYVSDFFVAVVCSRDIVSVFSHLSNSRKLFPCFLGGWLNPQVLYLKLLEFKKKSMQKIIPFLVL